MNRIVHAAAIAVILSAGMALNSHAAGAGRLSASPRSAILSRGLVRGPAFRAPALGTVRAAAGVPVLAVSAAAASRQAPRSVREAVSRAAGVLPDSFRKPIEARQAASALSGAYDGGGFGFGSGSGSLPDDSRSWYDSHTGQHETQASKIRKTLELAMSNPTAAAIKNALPENTLYRVENPWTMGGASYAVRTIGDDPERQNENEPVVIFTAQALRDLSPYYLAAKLASMWVRHLYKDKMPQSAEKTYIEGSLFIRVFMDLTRSTARDWRGDLDVPVGRTFKAYQHFYHWIQGFRYDNVRQGPYFKDKIMRDDGDPSIHTDARGRRTLFQRAQAGEISDAAAEKAQDQFDRFVSVEEKWSRENQ